MSTVIAWAGAGVAALVIVGLIWFAILTATRRTRLTMLTQRVDLARDSLGAALNRRCAVATAIAEQSDDPQTAHLASAAAAASAAPLADRETVENVLSGALAACDPGDLVSELIDAQNRVVMARRFYNDAVRDTRALRGRRMVRWLHLAGRAPRPNYFEIAEHVTPR